MPIPGARTEAQVRDNVGALQRGPLAMNTLATIETLLERSDEYEIRAR